MICIKCCIPNTNFSNLVINHHFVIKIEAIKCNKGQAFKFVHILKLLLEINDKRITVST